MKNKNEWSKFPVVRPLKKPITVIINGVRKNGIGIDTSYSGRAIKIEDEIIDSNYIVWWKYLS
jgi:regulator of extracellular matrix RemA (YlzA/DUF370 family)